VTGPARNPRGQSLAQPPGCLDRAAPGAETSRARRPRGLPAGADQVEGQVETKMRPSVLGELGRVAIQADSTSSKVQQGVRVRSYPQSTRYGHAAAFIPAETDVEATIAGDQPLSHVGIGGQRGGL